MKITIFAKKIYPILEPSYFHSEISTLKFLSSAISLMKSLNFQYFRKYVIFLKKKTYFVQNALEAFRVMHASENFEK